MGDSIISQVIMVALVIFQFTAVIMVDSSIFQFIAVIVVVFVDSSIFRVSAVATVANDFISGYSGWNGRFVYFHFTANALVALGIFQVVAILVVDSGIIQVTAVVMIFVRVSI